MCILFVREGFPFYELWFLIYVTSVLLCRIVVIYIYSYTKVTGIHEITFKVLLLLRFGMQPFACYVLNAMMHFGYAGNEIVYKIPS